MTKQSALCMRLENASVYDQCPCWVSSILLTSSTHECQQNVKCVEDIFRELKTHINNHGVRMAGEKTTVSYIHIEFIVSPTAGMKLSARPLALATISLVWAHEHDEIIKAFAHLATVNLLSCKHFISSFNLNTLTYIVDPIYLGALFRQHWFCTPPGGKLNHLSREV